MKKRKHNSFVAGFCFAWLRVRWDSRLLIALFVLLATFIALACLLAWEPDFIHQDPDFSRFFLECADRAKALKNEYDNNGDIDTLLKARYYETLSDGKWLPTQYYLLGGNGDFNEHFLRESITTARLFSLPSFLFLLAVILAWPLFLSESARVFRRNVTLASYPRWHFEIGVLLAYGLLLFMAATIGCAVIFALAYPREVLVFKAGEWTFHSAYLFWIRSWVAGTISLWLFGFLIVGIFSRLPARPSFKRGAILIAAILAIGSPFLFFASHVSWAFPWIRGTLFYGPLLLEPLSLTDVLLWVLQGAAIAGTDVFLYFGPRHNKN